MRMTTRLFARCSPADRQLLAQVASSLRRTPSDTLRFLIHEKATELHLGPNPLEKKETNIETKSIP